MGAPIGGGERRVLGYSIGYLIERAWAMRARCLACGQARTWTRAALEAWPPNVRLGEIEPRLRCACGVRDALVDVLNDTGERASRDLARYDAEQRGELRRGEG